MSKITTSLLQEMVQAAATRLGKQAEYVNSLNVFPVPDGDTGTNMGMTMDNGAKAVADQSASTVGEVGQILSKGLLMGARGNSGVITSQLFRGFGQSIKDKTELDGQDLAHAFQAGVEVAYKAVMKPVEGTILTVSRGAASAAIKKAESTNDAVEVMRAALDGAKAALAKTPEMLPVLKEAGVVDSGGQGLLEVFGYPSLTKGLSTEVFEEIKDLLEILISIKNDSTKNDLYTNGILLLLLSKVGTFIENSKELPERKSRQNSESHVQQAISIVEDFYGRDLTVQYIADKLNLNRSYLSEIFSKQMGVPLKKYILDFRITQSEEFLFTSDWSVDYISQICGFSSPSYFSKIFKEYHGISPTEYRKNRHKRERQIVLVK